MAGKSKRKNQHTNGVHEANGANTSTATPAPEPTPATIELLDELADDSPLRLFGEAKDRINSLFEKIDRNVSRACKFYSDVKLEAEVVSSADVKRLQQLSRSIETIRGVLSRNQMKVAFFGRTSNGKSTVINAILHDKVLPMGCGHTTGCFLQIQGDPNNEAFLEVHSDQHGDTREPIQSVSHLANAIKKGSLEHSTLVKIHWPISKCPLLKYDVVLVDSPGIDVEENLDEWIDEHCHDADLFVLVASGESTLNIAEKNFFHKVSEKLSKPNIFILNNRWDNLAYDPDMEEVREQHEKKSASFLSDELKISTREDALQRTFFVSALEMLQTRSPESFRTVPPLRDGHQERLEEFQNFERRFEESLSKSAVRTKFKKHTDRGKETIDELDVILKATQSVVLQVSHRKLIELQQCEDRCKSIQDRFYANEKVILNQIFDIKKKIQILSDTEFDNEIRRLSRVVDDFEQDFSPNPEKLKFYKAQLYDHVEEMLSENLKSRINNVVIKLVNPYNRIMCDLSLLLSSDKRQKVAQIIASGCQTQDELFDLRIYKQFYTDFQEDLEFRFSLGLVSIIRKFQSRFSIGKSTKMNTLDQSKSMISTETDFLSIVERFMMNPPQSPTTVGSLAIGGVLVRTVGWKVIVVTTVIYGALYAYEYLTWTNSAKERMFKAQYVRYAKKGLQDCVPIISQHIANSFEQRMSATFSDIKKEVDVEHRELTNKITTLRSSLDKLRICEEFASELLDQNNFLMNELVAFASSFLYG